jgi:hypothetical protein
MKTARLVSLRIGIVAFVCVSLILNSSLLRLSSVTAASTSIDLKTETQYRSEAGRYDNAVNAINGIASMTLNTPDQLKHALDILDRERTNLELHRSMLIVMAISDATFSRGIRKRAPDKKAAEALVKDLSANPRAVFKFEGAESLKARMQRRVQADAAVMTRAAERLKEAADRITKTRVNASPGLETRDDFSIVRAGFNSKNQLIDARESSESPVQVEVAIFTIVVALFAATVIIGFAALFGEVVGRFFRVDNEEELAKCQKETDESYSACVARADREPFPINIAKRAICGIGWLSRHKDCLLNY